MCDIVKYLTLFLLFVLLPAANAQTRVNGNINSAFAVGKWKESHEGVSLFCARVTNQSEVIKGNSNGACFLTEAEASAKDSVRMSAHIFTVTTWNEHTLTATTDFYADQNGVETSKSNPDAIRFVLRLLLNFDAHEMTKFAERSTGSTKGYHLEDQ